MKPMYDPFNNEESAFGQSGKFRKNKVSEHELDDLREHIDQISFNLGKVYQHAKDRSRKHSLRNSLKKKIHHFYKNEKSGC